MAADHPPVIPVGETVDKVHGPTILYLDALLISLGVCQLVPEDLHLLVLDGQGQCMSSLGQLQLTIDLLLHLLNVLQICLEGSHLHLLYGHLSLQSLVALYLNKISRLETLVEVAQLLTGLDRLEKQRGKIVIT